MLSRRKFIRDTALLGASPAVWTAPLVGGGSMTPKDRILLGMIGVNGRGNDLASTFAGLPGAEVAVVCDVDERAMRKASLTVEKKTGRAPQSVGDIRKLLENPDIDAVVVATPDHWHAPAAILACAAGKHVYVEKPVCHSPHEGELLIAAARKHARVVQVGTQRRSMPGVLEAIEKIRSGVLGRALLARGWYNNGRKTIGHGRRGPVPAWLNYELWQGPAPERPFRDNLVHYNWHWFWHWGTGELGNNGIHSLDVCRWGLGVDYPQRVTSGGGKYRWDDDQETPDTHVATFDFGDRSITWEGRSWSKRGFEDSDFGIAFYGEKGSMVIEGGNYRLYDTDNRLLEKVTGSSSDMPHLQNFLDAVRSGARPHADIEEGYKSTLLCHLGNIAYRTGRTLHCDARNGHIRNDREAMALWSREYRKGWEPKV